MTKQTKQVEQAEWEKEFDDKFSDRVFRSDSITYYDGVPRCS